MLTNGSVPKPGMGIYVKNVSTEMSNLYRLPIGVIVMQVIPGENAENAGMEKGDIIVEVNGKKIMDTDDLSNILKELEVGKTAEVYVVRNGDTSLKLDVVIGDMNNMAE